MEYPETGVLGQILGVVLGQAVGEGVPQHRRVDQTQQFGAAVLITTLGRRYQPGQVAAWSLHLSVNRPQPPR
jgi:hypothetical protein